MEGATYAIPTTSFSPLFIGEVFGSARYPLRYQWIIAQNCRI
jgi:hypothetical protein